MDRVRDADAVAEEEGDDDCVVVGLTDGLHTVFAAISETPGKEPSTAQLAPLS